MRAVLGAFATERVHHHRRSLRGRHTVPGTDLVLVTGTPFGAIGLSTCYDVRFAEVSSLLLLDFAANIYMLLRMLLLLRL